MVSAQSTIGSLVEAVIRWLLPAIGFLKRFIWLPLIQVASTCGWDRDSRYSASITNPCPRASAPPSVNVDLESNPGSATKLETPPRPGTCQLECLQGQQNIPLEPDTGRSSNQIPGLMDQQKAYPKVGVSGLQYRRPIQPEDLMWHKILCIYLDEWHAGILALNSIGFFDRSEKEFLSLLWMRTEECEIRDIIYSPVFLEFMDDRPDAIMFQVRLIPPIQHLF